MIYLQRQEYDAIVVGSGISGGWAAKELCEKGLTTLVLERGRELEHRKYTTEHVPSWEIPLRDRKLTVEQAPKHPIQSHVYLFRESTRQYFLEDAKNPYVQDEPFLWIQGDHVG
ncbi:MAG: GMC family oxidoreductase, partial [Gemmatimonadetes bacterium]|nr:GMC family oxidoreductase [Gemmatimonadota bacterium]